MLKVALIGLGGMGRGHYKSYKKLDGAKVVAVVEMNPDAAREKLGEDDVKIYTSMDELFAKEEVDIVDICTPTYMHANMCVKALEAGYHVLCEKPLALTNEDVAKIKAAAKASGKTFMVAHVVRFMTPYIYLRNLIKNETYGKLKKLSMRRVSKLPDWGYENWFADVKRSGGAALDMGVHDIDFVQSVLGMPDTTCSAYYKMHGENGSNDFLFSTLVYGDAVVSIESGWYACDYKFEATYEAVFERARVRRERSKTFVGEEEVEMKLGEAAEDTGIGTTGADGYTEEIAYFIDCVNKGIKDPDYVSIESVQNSIKLARSLIDGAITVK